MGVADGERPEAYLPGDRRRAIARGEVLPDRVMGSGMFVDISGFTPLTEALVNELGPHRGPEELTAHLDRVFHAVINDVHRFGGEVIYFSGDAITCWLDGDDGRRAAFCGLAIQQTMDAVGTVRTPRGTVIMLAIKVAVAVGPARRFVVGDPSIQLIDVLAGRLVDELADAEHQADKGDVVLAASALVALGAEVTVRQMRGDVGVLSALAGRPPDTTAVENDWLTSPLDEQLARPWLLPAVHERLTTGGGEFLAELRSAYPLFVRFGGIDFDDDPDAIAKLDDFVRRSQEILTDLGGNLLQLTVGDKGAYLYAAFGSPHAHEDDASRACVAALELLTLEKTTAARDLQIGIAHGHLRSGTYGHPQRRTFTCLGDAVNLAARLMARAPVGHVYVTTDVQEGAAERVISELVGNLTVKGKVEPVSVRSLVGLRRATQHRVLRYPLPIIGRDREVTALRAAADATLAGESRVVGIGAEAGRGKSRLIAELVRGLRADGRSVVFGEGQSFGRAQSYLIWQEAWRTLFDIDDDADGPSQRRRIEQRLARTDRGLERRAPLLGPVLGVEIPDNELTSAFDAKLRKTSLESLLVDVLLHEVGLGPLVIILEDCHWIDPLSRDLLEELIRATAGTPTLFVLAYRPAQAPGGGLGLMEFAQFDEIVLHELGGDAAREVARIKIAQLWGVGAIFARELVELVVERAQGNPFYLEELLSYMHGLGVDPSDVGAVRAAHVPDSLQRLMLGRLDMLPEAPRNALKIASVIGRHFDTPSVHGVRADLGTLDEIDARLELGARADLVASDRIEDRSWLFRHVVTREVAYDSLPFAMRARLHDEVGRFVESGGEEAIERNLDLLAHHYMRGESDGKKREFTVRAGVAAQARYANDAAVEHFRNALPLLAEAEQPAILRRLGKVLELGGHWAEAEAEYVQAAALSERLGQRLDGARAGADLAESMRKQGRFDEARTQLARSREIFEDEGDDAGVGLLLHLGGTLASQQGRYDEARASYEASLVIRERLGDRAAVGSVLSNLAVVAESVGDNDLARTMNERALAVRQAVGDPWAICVSQNNLGMVELIQRHFTAAKSLFEDSTRLAGEVGDRWIVAVGEHNLGNATLGLGEFAEAGTHFDAARQVYEAHNDKWSMALLAEDVVLLALALDRWEIAAKLVGVADALREHLDAPRPPAVATALDAATHARREWWLTNCATAGQEGRDRREVVIGEAIQELAALPLSVVDDAM